MGDWGEQAGSRGPRRREVSSLYGDVPRADETERRRARQLVFSEAHGIRPRTVRKNIADIMEGARADGEEGKGGRRRAAEPRMETRPATSTTGSR